MSTLIAIASACFLFAMLIASGYRAARPQPVDQRLVIRRAAEMINDEVERGEE